MALKAIHLGVDMSSNDLSHIVMIDDSVDFDTCQLSWVVRIVAFAVSGAGHPHKGLPPSTRGSQQPSHCQELASPEGRRKYPPAPSNSRWNQHAFRNQFHAETDIRKSSDGINSRHISLPPVILVTSAEDGDQLPTPDPSFPLTSLLQIPFQECKN